MRQTGWPILRPMIDSGRGDNLRQLTRVLAPEIEYPHQIALALLAHVTSKPKAWVIAHTDACLTTQQVIELESLTMRIKKGEPLAYLTGKQEFYGLEFKVTPDVLIPRPETESLVDLALDWLGCNPQAFQSIDVGTGSGCIAISLLRNHPSLIVDAVEKNPAALQVALTNARLHAVSARFNGIQSDLLSKVQGKYSLVCANLPYVPSAKVAGVNSIAWEPRLALDGGEDGLNLIRTLLLQVPPFLYPKALVLLETESTLGPATLQLAQELLPQAVSGLLKDHAGRDRIVRIEFGV